MKPNKLSTVYTVGAKLFNKNGLHIANCLDTPNAIAKAIMEYPDIEIIKPFMEQPRNRDYYADRMMTWNKANSNLQKLNH
jgi:hypothetical protein